MTDRGRPRVVVEPTRRPLVVRARPVMWAPPLFVVLSGLANARLHPLFLVGVPLGLGYLVVLARTRTVADDEGVEARTPRRTRRLPWAEVAVLRRGRGGVVAVTRAGEEVPLPNVEWRAPVPSDPEYVYRGSGQAVVARARAAGHEVALET